VNCFEDEEVSAAVRDLAVTSWDCSRDFVVLTGGETQPDIEWAD
jgi:hypothetical protein